MTRTKLKDRALPPYTRGEEICNMTTHILGAAFGIAALVLCVVTAAGNRNVWGIVTGAVYGTMMILLYTMSSIYHGLTNITAKKVFQVIDHCTIYFLIAGTYIPLLLTGIRQYNPILGWTLFGLVVGCSALGITLTAIDLRKFRAFSMACYFTVGWSLIFVIKPLLKVYPMSFFLWILAGGVAYTTGIIFYALGTKHRYSHSIFHVFVIAGSVLQFFGILFYCM